jgi:hypothetical protein
MSIVCTKKLYCREYRPEHDRLMKDREAILEEHRQENMSRMMKDLKVDRSEPCEGPGPDPRSDSWGPGEEDDEGEEDDGEIIDRSMHLVSIPSASASVYLFRGFQFHR